MIGRMAGWTVLALLAFSSAPKADAQATDLLLSTMTFSNDGADTTLVVCSIDTIATGADIVVQLAVQNSAGQNSYASVSTAADPQCATFTIEGTDLPSGEETKYELVVGADGAEVQSGIVTFAFPEAETFICSGTTFGRFKDVDTSTVDGSLCLLPDEPLSVCYFEIASADPSCLPGLDSVHPTFEVCTDHTATVAPPIEPFPVALTYVDDGNSGTFTVPASTLTQGTPAELLYKKASGATILSICTDTVCASTDFAPSQDSYGLCAVYTGTEDEIVNFGATTFQDLQLTVDIVTGTDVVDFHFKNMYTEKTYDITSEAGGTAGPFFSLDCTNIAEGDTCNGFFDYANRPTGATIAVSYEDGTITVIAPVI